jgi:hypothetical protein
MRRIAIAALLLVACGSPSASRAPEAPLEIAPLDAGGSPKATLPNPREADLDLAAWVASEDVRSVTEAHAAAFLNVAAVRSLPSAPRIRELVESKTEGMKVFDDVDWVLWAGPDISHADNGVVLVGVRPGADVQWSIERLMRGSSSSHGGRLDEVDVDGVRGWRLPGGKVVLRLRDDLLVIASEKQERAAVASFRKHLPGRPPSRELVGMYGTASGARLGGMLLPSGQLEELRFTVETQSTGAEIKFDGRCADAANAKSAADSLNTILAQVNTGSVRLMTRGILNDAKATASGEAVSIRIAVSESQLDFLVQALVSLP